MTLRVTIPEVVDPLVFGSRAELAEWANQERAFWVNLGVSGMRATDRHARDAQTQFARLAAMATNAETPDDQLQTAAEQTAATFFTSKTPKAQLLESIKMLGHDPRTVTAALAALLRANDELRQHSSNHHWTYDIAMGAAHVAAFEAGGEPQKLTSLLKQIGSLDQTWTNELAAARLKTEENVKAHDEAMRQLRESVETSNRAVTAASASYQQQLDDIRREFEEKFALRTPMTYWTEKAQRHVKAASKYLNWFAGLLLGGVAAFSAVGYFYLVPFLLKNPTAYWTLLLFSVLVAVWAWPLRMTSKLYLTHRHLYEDAAEREVISRTFLALSEKVQMSDADRQLLLTALMRHAPVSLVGDDSGLNLADLLLAKTLTKS